MLHPYYHISFNGKLTGEWSPKTPAGFDHVKDRIAFDDNMAEPKLPRICLANTIEGCFHAVYPNVYNLYGSGYRSRLQFYVYQTYVDTSSDQFVGNAKLTNDRLVWDAHITGEVWWLANTKMRLYQLVKIGVDRNKVIRTHPFGDNDYSEKFCGYIPKIEIVKRFPSFYETAS